MATFAPPVRRGDFLYSSVLYADPGNGNHHPRAGTAELAALLRPETPNLYSSGQLPPATPAKDPVWHWYAAQLIHCGLPVTKDKNAAKVRLLTALNQFKLEVPAWILKLEGELKREWEGGNKKMKKSAVGGAKKDKFVKQAGSRGQGAAQMSPLGSGINVNVNVSFGSGISNFGETSSPSLDQKEKGKRKRDAGDSSNGTPSPKKPAHAAIPASAFEQSSGNTASSPPRDDPPRSQGRNRQTARKTTTPRIKQEPVPKSSQYAQTRIKQEHESTGYGSPRSYVKQEHAPIIILSGTYDIDDVNIPAEVDFSVYRDVPRDVWWATATVQTTHEHRRFVIKMDPGPSADALGQAVTLGWRIRDGNTDEVRSGKGCTGEATFMEDGSVIVLLKGVPDLGNVRFSGYRMGGASQPGDLQEEWDGFRRDAYGR